MTDRTIGHAVLGLGFMGQTHIRALGHAAEAGDRVRLAAVCDSHADRLSGRTDTAGNIDTPQPADGEAATAGDRLFDPETVHASPSLDEVLALPSVHSVSVCTPTHTHVAIARQALAAGKHVLLEKPVALNASAIADLSLEARDRGLVCMPAMCMRWWPEWAWLGDAIRDDRFGPLRSLRLERVGARPTWNPAFYNDVTRSGGALFDLHVHDTDFVCATLGLPREVHSVGTRDHLTTAYRYGPPRASISVVATGGWLSAPSTPFRMRYLAEFDDAVADFDLTRKPSLVVHQGNATAEPTYAHHGQTGYELQMRAFLRALSDQSAQTVTLDDAAAVTRVLQAELASLEQAVGIAVPLK